MSLIAILSDVHGNLPALQAVLKDINRRKADQVYCLGDLVDFPPAIKNITMNTMTRL